MKSMPRYIIIELLKTNDKVWKALKEKKTHYLKGETNSMQIKLISYLKSSRPEGSGTIFSSAQKKELLNVNLYSVTLSFKNKMETRHSQMKGN